MRLRIMEFAIGCCMLITPLTAFADDAQIAKQLSETLRSAKTDGQLNGFHLGVKVEDGTVWIKGQVASEEQRALALDRARRIPGVRLVVNDIELSAEERIDGRADMAVGTGASAAVTPAVAVQTAPIARRRPSNNVTPQQMPRPVIIPSPTPVPSRPAPVTQSYARQAPTYQTAMATPGPAEMNGQRVQYAQDMGYQDGGGAVSDGYAEGGYVDGSVVSPTPACQSYSEGGGINYEQPQMPAHAWPSYASYPNYGAVTYPKQYSASAWPYIGPFYPYPQVPMGWRKVSLEWDDGWWMLDFSAK